MVNLDLYADYHLISDGMNIYRRDRVKSFSQQNRQFKFRAERKSNITVVNPFISDEMDHDAFSAIGGNNVSLKS